MEVLSQIELEQREKEIISRIREGEIFIYPTDTIYGIGCDATNEVAVQKIYKIKQRPKKPFSILVPSLKWIKSNCVITKSAKEGLSNLPGPYTIILELKNIKAIAKNVNPNGNSIGTRIPNHWFSEIVKNIGTPIITTSANKSGQQFMTSLETLDQEIKSHVNFMIYEGEKKARPSKIINTLTDEINVR